MEIKLNIYKDRFCREVERTAVAKDFELSTGICEDIMNFINIDMLEGGLDALSNESKKELILELVKNGYPYIIELIKELFELTDDETKRIKLPELAGVVIKIVTYSVNQLASSLGVKAKRKN